MSKKIDETGKRYGKIVVLQQVLDPIEREKRHGAACWLCKCDCGQTFITTGHELRRGKRKTCGKKQCSNLVINQTGNKYGKLTVLKYAGLNKIGQALWECKCDCGNTVKILGINLRNGNSRSCGCLKSKGELKIIQLLLKNNIPFEKEKKFETCIFDNSDYSAKFDFYINSKYLIEYDGIQHFKYFDSQTTWNTKENLIATQKRDQFKNKWCKQNNIPLIRIPYTQYNNLKIQDLLLETSSFVVT